MKLLLDTHVLLWWLNDSRKLTAEAKAQIAEPTNTVFVSAVSIWEIQIKEGLGKIRLPRSFASVLEHEEFEELSITVEHAHAVGRLPTHHRDPFDRMLIAQALTEGITILTHDRLFSEYSAQFVLV